MKFSEAIEKFVGLHESEDWNSETQRYYRGKIPIINRYLGSYNVLDIDIFVIADFTKKQRTIKDLNHDIVKIIFDHLYINRNQNKNYRAYFKYYFMFNLMLETGARISEVINIKIENIDISDRSIFLEVTKYDKERYVFFTKKVTSIYMKYLNRYEVTNDYLFLGNSKEEQ